MASRATAQALDRLDARRSSTSKTPLRILIADDHDIVRRGVRTVLSSHPDWEVCAEAATGREAVAKAKQQKPDIVVMDLSMPELNGLEAARKIRKVLPKTEVVMLSFHFSDQLVREIVEAGAHAYILKTDADRDFGHVEMSKRMGADVVIDYHEQNVGDAVRKLTRPTCPATLGFEAPESTLHTSVASTP